MNGKEQIVGYHRRTMHHIGRHAAGPGYMDWENQPDSFRVFKGTNAIDLPLAADQLSTRYADLDTSASIPPYPMNLEGVATMFELALGISAWKSHMGERWAVRCNPSSGNLHPTEGYLISPQSIGPGAGVWHYESQFHRLEKRGAVQGSEWSDHFPQGLFFVGLSSIHGRESWKYGERAFRYCQLNLGHAEMAFCIAATSLGWKTALLDYVSDTDLTCLLGLETGPTPLPSEQEHPGSLLAMYSGGISDGTSNSTIKKLLSHSESVTWSGRPNRLAVKPLREWIAVREAHEATLKPSQPPTPLKINNILPPLLPCPTEKKASDLIRQRRSAVRYDGKSSIPKHAFFRILDALLPRTNGGYWNLFNDEAKIHLILMVHHVSGMESGLYVLPRRPGILEPLKKAMWDYYLWDKVEVAPEHLPLYLLETGDFQDYAQRVSCNQEIAADGAFSLGMIAEFENELDKGAWHYRRLHEEAGAVGQTLYLEAESAGFQGTGIGCFFDDLFHDTLGLEGLAFQTLYHFTIGVGVSDNRLETHPPYAHISR
jgi:SagB-type dehydrogenase family enzyme